MIEGKLYVVECEGEFIWRASAKIDEERHFFHVSDSSQIEGLEKIKGQGMCDVQISSYDLEQGFAVVLHDKYSCHNCQSKVANDERRLISDLMNGVEFALTAS